MNETQLQKAIAEALQRLGVQVAGTHQDPLRWSATDLAKDVADLLFPELIGMYIGGIQNY